jgi:hypothetical protein
MHDETTKDRSLDDVDFNAPCACHRTEGFTGLIQINRRLGGSEVLSPTDAVSHTFVAYVDNGVVMATATWGDNSLILGQWGLNTLFSTMPNYSNSSTAVAQGAFDSGMYVVVHAGGTYENFLTTYSDTSSALPHPNLGLVFNCKWAAWVFGNNYYYVSTGSSSSTSYPAPDPAYTDTDSWMEMHLHPAYWMALHTSQSALNTYNNAVTTQTQLKDKLR